MKIAFFASNTLPIHAESLNERPMGGTETGIIRLAEALQALGHEVTVFTPHTEPPPSQPLYLPHSAIEKHPPVDALVAIRDWIPTFYKIQAKRRFFWSGDSYDVFSNFGLGDKRVGGMIDAFLTVSDWQADRVCEASGFPREKCWKISNGIDLKLFEGTEVRHRKRLIYSSTPYRGLRHIPRFFTELKKQHPDLECHIFSSYKIYDLPTTPEFEELRQAAAQFPDLHFHESVKQKELAREFMKSSILFYPCEFEETSCITAMEAMAAGAVVLSTKMGALPETVGDAGILIDGRPGEPQYDRMFFAGAHELLSNDERWSRHSLRGKERAQTLSWKKVAERFAQFLWLLLKQERTTPQNLNA